MSKEWMATSYKGLYEQSEKMRMNVEGNQGRYGIAGTSAEWFTNVFGTAQKDYGEDYKLYADPAKRTPNVIKLRKFRRHFYCFSTV